MVMKIHRVGRALCVCVCVHARARVCVCVWGYNKGREIFQLP